MYIKTAIATKFPAMVVAQCMTLTMKALTLTLDYITLNAMHLHPFIHICADFVPHTAEIFFEMEYTKFMN